LKKQLIVIGMMLVLIAVGLSGCTDNQIGVLTNAKPPANINTFASAKEGELIRFYFMLEDEDGVNTISEGYVKMEIFDDSNNPLYYQEFDVKESDFVDYGFKLTGTGIGKAYEWRVPINDIEESKSTYGFGRAVLTFVTPQYNTLSAEDTLVQIPTYSEEELEDMEEEDYENSCTLVNKKISKGNFEITVAKAGFFENSEWGVTNQYFRVDMGVKNVGSESDYFTPLGLAIIDSQNIQYEYTYGGTLDVFSTIHSGVTKKGYLLFENVPTTEKSVRLLFELGYDANFNSYLFEYNIKLK
jgi:hypothetical protein